MSHLSDETLAEYDRIASFVRGGTEPVGIRESAYRRLVRNIFLDTLSRAYPLAKSWLPRVRGAGAWEAIVERFILEGSPPSPELWRMPEAFVRFVAERSEYDIPGFLDLLRFEWVEIEVFMMPDEIPERPAAPGVWLSLNPHRRFLDLQYPVFATLGEDLVGRRGAYRLVCFRRLDNLDVRYLSVDADGERILVALAGGARSADEFERSEAIPLFFDEGLLVCTANE